MAAFRQTETDKQRKLREDIELALSVSRSHINVTTSTYLQRDSTLFSQTPYFLLLLLYPSFRCSSVSLSTRLPFVSCACTSIDELSCECFSLLFPILSTQQPHILFSLIEIRQSPGCCRDGRVVFAANIFALLGFAAGSTLARSVSSSTLTRV